VRFTDFGGLDDISLLDVMSDELGGKAKGLWSLVTGDSKTDF
jgi:hypothetical protein